MAFNYRNNAKTSLTTAITLSSTGFSVTAGEGALFPTSNFIVTLEHRSPINGQSVVTKRQIANCTRSGDNFTFVDKTDETCVQNDTLIPKVRSNNSLTFEIGDSVSMYITETIANVGGDVVTISDIQTITAPYKTFNGKVGIGTSTVPVGKLEIEQNENARGLVLTQNGNGIALEIYSQATSARTIDIRTYGVTTSDTALFYTTNSASTGDTVRLLNNGIGDSLSIEGSGQKTIKINNGTAPAVTSNRLYVVSGNLYWAGTQLN